MAVNPMLSSGANGLQQGMRGLEQAAHEVADLNVRTPGVTDAPETSTKLDNHADVAEAMLDLKLYQRQVQASAKVVQTADEVIGFLLSSA